MQKYLKYAFADRANHLGDPDRITVPIKQMLAIPSFNRLIYDSFQQEQTLEPEAYGTKLNIGNDEGTQHISVIDKDGLSISLTSTLNTYFGSGVIALDRELF